MTGPFLGLCLNALSFFGLCLNLYILVIVFITKQTEGGGGRLLLGHLGLTGSLLCLLTLLTGLPLPCSLTGSLFALLHPLELYTLCGLNCDRYAAIAAPLHYARLVKPRKVLLGLGLAWLLALGLALPPLFISQYTYSQGLLACSPDLSVRGGLCYSAIYTALTLLLPIAVIMACNLKVLMIARYHRHRIARAIFEVTLSAQVTITHQKNPFVVSSGSGRGRSPTATVLQLVGSVIILYSPYYCIILWQGLGRKPSPGLLAIASSLLACAPTLNGLLYGLKNKLLRRAFRHYWRKKMTKNELEQEIQARTPSRRPSLTPQKVWRPVSTSALGTSPVRVGSLRHSATSTSILAARGKPRITITSDDGPTPPVRIKIGGSSSSVSADSDLTQEEREWRWLAASSSSLPATSATFLPYFTSIECMRSGSETGLMDSVIAL
ncbi:histamine H2 receptor isoform X2 [Halyomorpha halys]|uniref:histamine H2 receptor isoform X2 n=1 Tax=Halyomorpha halys TaxID=286706 RepID=UPI0006D4DEA7|nr:G protein-coupled receptor 161-like isoform X2 [Halyomorpha halys]